MNKKGFTLIELLSIIVILAVIALISTPIITNTIANVRKNSDRESAREYVRIIETSITQAALEYPNIVIGSGITNATGNATREWPCTSCSAENKLKVEYKGTSPQKATLSYDADTGKITGKLKYANGCWEVTANGDLSELTESDTFCQ